VALSVLAMLCLLNTPSHYLNVCQENKVKLFETVVQFDPNILQSGGGSGLGLFISNAIVKRHPGGVIGVMPGGVEAVESDGDGDGVRLDASATATTGCIFYIEVDGCLGKTTQEPERKLSVSTHRLNFSRRTAGGGSNDYSHRTNVSKGSVGHMETFLENRKSSWSPEDSVSEFDTLLESCGHMEIFDRVLVVEDSKFNRKMMVKALSSYAKEVCLAEDGVEAVTAVRKGVANLEPPYDVIFMDSLMPNMNGIDATKIILRELKFPNPIVAVTGNMLPEDVREFEDAGVRTVLGKPLQLDELDRVLKGKRCCCVDASLSCTAAVFLLTVYDHCIHSA